MKARDFVNHRFRKALNGPIAKLEVMVILYFVSMGFWHVFWADNGPETWVYRCGAAGLVIVAGFDIIRYSRLSKSPIECPHCEKPLLLRLGWTRLPNEFKYCPSCGTSMDGELNQKAKAEPIE